MQCFCSDVMTVSCALVQLVVILAVSHIAIQCCTCSSLIEPYPANLAKRQRHVLHTKPTWIYSSPALPQPMMTNQVAIVSTTSSLISIALHFHPVIFFHVPHMFWTSRLYVFVSMQSLPTWANVAHPSNALCVDIPISSYGHLGINFFSGHTLYHPHASCSSPCWT